MKDILLIYPTYSYPRKSPPLGLAYLASYVEQFGYKPRIFDLNVMVGGDDAFASVLREKDWLLVGMSFMTSQFGEARRLAAFIKALLPDTLLVAGGPHASSIPERTLKEIPQLDVVVKGEGEESLRELADAMAEGGGPESIAGLYYRDNGRIVTNPPRQLFEKLDALPFPAWGYIDVSLYSVFSISTDRESPVFALLSSRGCPNACTFCDSHTIFERKYRPRSARNMFEEIMALNQTYGMTVFDFVDDLITVQKQRVLEFCDLLNQSGVRFTWMANARVNTVDREMLSAMKSAGCIRVDFGVETGDPEVRRLMHKNITDDQVREAHLLAKEVGLSTGSFTMVGNLGETRESAKMTVELLREIGDDVMVSIACPFPGTELYRIAKEKRFINTEDWTKYVTSPTYTRAFRPVMCTEHMSEEDILDAFYYIHSFFFQKKFRRRFGRWFMFRPKFYRDWMFASEGLGRRLKMALRLIRSRLRG